MADHFHYLASLWIIALRGSRNSLAARTPAALASDNWLCAVRSVTSAVYHLLPKHDHAYEMFRGGPNRIKPALETNDTVH